MFGSIGLREVALVLAVLVVVILIGAVRRRIRS